MERAFGRPDVLSIFSRIETAVGEGTMSNWITGFFTLALFAGMAGTDMSRLEPQPSELTAAVGLSVVREIRAIWEEGCLQALAVKADTETKSGIFLSESDMNEEIICDAAAGSRKLTYVETDFSVDSRFYSENASELLALAERALEELYQITGTKIEESYFTVTEYGDVSFAMTESQLKAGQDFFSRCYGAREGFEDCITCITITDSTFGYLTGDSPVEYYVMPPERDTMTDEEIVQWYFENSPLSDLKRWRFGRTEVLTGDRVDTIEESFEDNYVIRTQAKLYYELTYNKETKTVSAYYGPYDSYPVH